MDRALDFALFWLVGALLGGVAGYLEGRRVERAAQLEQWRKRWF